MSNIKSVEIKNLSLVFETNDGPVHALNEIELDIIKGDYVSLIGPSGCGKTTLLRVIADLQEPTSGSILVNEKSAERSRMERDFDFWTRYRKPNTEKAVEEYYKISKKYNLDMSQMSIKFCEAQDFMTSVIIGATTMEQLKTNIESVKVNLDLEVIKEINGVQKKYPNPCP